MEPFCAAFQKNSVSGKVNGQEVGGVSRHSVDNFLSHSAETFSRGSLLVFHYFRLSKKFE